MKKLILSLALTMSQVSFAAIPGSNHEERHQDLIEKAIAKNCGAFRELTQLSSTEEVVVVDQGIRDEKYKTILTGLQRLDQNIFDRYVITVNSEFADMYDHSAQDWGAYSVSSVSCQME